MDAVELASAMARLVKLASEPPPPAPRIAADSWEASPPPAPAPRGDARARVGATVRRAEAWRLEISAALYPDEPDDAGRVRLYECCQVADAMVACFGGFWGVEGLDVVYEVPRRHRLDTVERAAATALAVRGVRVVVL